MAEISIPMSSPDISNLEKAAITDVLNTTSFSFGGQLLAFERAITSYVGVNYGVGVNSGTSGLHLCIIAANVQERDFVITSPFSFIASANCILYERGIPIFVDVDRKTGNMSPEYLEAAIHDIYKKNGKAKRWLPRTVGGSSRYSQGHLKAVLPVHAFGQPADMNPILEIAHSFELPVIEDACEALGSGYLDKKAGSLGDAAVFAFYPNKQITTGEGGMVVTNKEDWHQLFLSLRNQGRDVFDAWLNHTRLGYNYRLDEFSAALGVAQMKRIDELLSKRQQVALWYKEFLQGIDSIEISYISPTTTKMSWFVYVIKILPPARRDDVMKGLADVGIPSRPYFTPIHLQPFYVKQFGYRPGDFPNTEYLGEVSLALPFSGVMSKDQVEQVCNSLRKILREY